MKKLIILLLFIPFFSFIPQEPSNSLKGKFDRPKLHLISKKTSCICDFNDMFIPNKEIDISNFIDGEELKQVSKNNKLLIHNRKDILEYESLLWDGDEIDLLKLNWQFMSIEIKRIEKELKKIYKRNKQKDLSSNLSSFWILQLLNPDLYSTDKNKVIELREKYTKLLSKYKEADILYDCLILKDYDNISILITEFEYSFFWEFESKDQMDNYYRTKLNFSEAKSSNELGFYFLRRIFSILGYLPYVVVASIILFKLKKKRKKTKTV
jgi:hypothetical protein